MIKKTLIRIFTILTFATAALSAYAQTTYTGAQISAKVAFQNNNSNGINITSLQSSSQNNILNVETTIQNSGTGNRHVYYRVRWLDNQGGQIGANSSWRPVLLMPGKSQSIKDISPFPNAADFTLEINVE